MFQSSDLLRRFFWELPKAMIFTGSHWFFTGMQGAGARPRRFRRRVSPAARRSPVPRHCVFAYLQCSYALRSLAAQDSDADDLFGACHVIDQVAEDVRSGSRRDQQGRAGIADTWHGLHPRLAVALGSDFAELVKSAERKVKKTRR